MSEFVFSESWKDPLIARITACQCFVPLEGNVLIVSDRMARVAVALAESFSRCTSCTVLGVASTRREAEQQAAGIQVDFIIFAGYQMHSDNYLANFPGAVRVMWATMDNAIEMECKIYAIPYVFEKYENLREFFVFLHRVG